MRIPQANLKAFVKESLLNIRTACEEAMAAGLIVELPTKVDFQVEVVQAAQAVTQVTATAQPTRTTTEAAATITTTESASVDTTVQGQRTSTVVHPSKTTTEAAASIVTTESPSVDTTTTSRTVTQSNASSGSDTSDTNTDYEEF